MLRVENRSYKLEELYKVLGVTRQAIWQSENIKEKQSKNVDEIISKVIKARQDHPKMGSRTLYYTMKNKGIEINIGINKFEHVLSENDLTVGRCKKYKPKTSDGKGRENYPNLIDGLEINDINKVIVGDITYYMADRKWHYIISLKDIYSQFIVGLEVSQNQDANAALLCLKAVEKLRGKENLKGCIHHSDNGSQYNSTEYKKLLKELGMQISRAENCMQNGSSEQFHGIIKNMYFEPWGVVTYQEMQLAKPRFLHLNNYERSIAQLGNMSPGTFENELKKIPLELRIKKQLHDFKKQN